MKMNKALKISALTLSAIGGAIGAVAASNKIIFGLIKRKDKDFAEGAFYDWEHGKVHYIKKGSGAPLVLIHGLTLGSSHREFTKNIDALSAHATVYALDLPGYGYSDKPKITYTAFIYASFINRFIREVIGNPVTLLGANGGGMLCTITTKLFPDNIRKLILVSPTGIDGKMAENEDVYKRTLHELPLLGDTLYTSSTSRGNIKSFLREEGFFGVENIDDEIVDIFHFSAHGTDSNARYSYASFKTNYMNMDIRGYFKNLPQPVCVLWGEGNLSNPVSNMNILSELKPKETYYIFEETRLYPHLENPDEFNDIITKNL